MATCPEDALEIMGDDAENFDLVILDYDFGPKMNGLEALTRIKKIHPDLPVIILTARGEEADRVRGLHDGADDYVVKPFSVKELLARVEAVLRRSAERPTDVARINIPGGSIDLERREVRFDDGRRTDPVAIRFV